MPTLAHCSDWHATPVEPSSPLELCNKRILGWLSWNVKRSKVHLPGVLDAMFRDLREQAPAHVAVTGDLTNVALESEFRRAADWLATLGSPDWVSAIPGNHDAYVATEPSRGWDLWAPYLCSDPPEGRAPPSGTAPRPEDFPTVRVRGELAIIGLCSANPSPWFRATGRLGKAQLARLEDVLRELEARGKCRVVLVHHPPTERHVTARRQLIDSAGLRAVLERVGAELVLHGHVHRSVVDQLAGPRGPIPAVGVPSASDVGAKAHKRAQYHLYDLEACKDFEESGGPRFRVRARVRGYDPEGGRFVDEGERALA